MTLEGDCMFVANRALMRKVDEVLLEKYSIIELVDKASECLLKQLKKYSSFYICCGGGNNGADGYALACKLHALNKKVMVFPCDFMHMTQACSYFYKECVVKQLVMSDFNEFKQSSQTCEIGIDACFGFGLHSNPKGSYQDAIAFMNASNQHIVSIDVPSGLDCDTGKAYENCVHAHETLTFLAMKQGFLNPDSVFYTGSVQILQLDVDDFSNYVPLWKSIDSVSFKPKAYDGHKGTYGKAFLVCGSDAYKGAALLSTKACVYSGCGITCLNSCESILNIMPIYCPEATLSKRENIQDIHRYDAVLIGCGLDEKDENIVEYVMKETKLPLVVDASALNILSKHLDWLENQNRPIILTPHVKEFERLCPNTSDIMLSAIQFASNYHCIMVLKGPHTLISDGIHTYRNMSGNGAMASGGSGDVLAGMIVSLLAQKLLPLDAAIKGVYLHGIIGDELAKKNHTVLPSKIIEEIPIQMKKHQKK